MAPKIFIKKHNISACKRRVWNLYITPRCDEPAISLKRSEKNHPETGFAMRVSMYAKVVDALKSRKSSLRALYTGPKISCQTKNVFFFKVGDTLTML